MLGSTQSERERWTFGAIYGTIYGVRKTTLYFSEDELVRLRRLSAKTGRPQADLVREAVEQYASKLEGGRDFESHASGASGKKRSIAQYEEKTLRKDASRTSGWR